MPAAMFPSRTTQPAAVARGRSRAAGKDDWVMMFRPDLTDYLPYIQALADRLNEGALYTMSLTDVVKIAIERSMQSYAPDVIIDKTRRKYDKINF